MEILVCVLLASYQFFIRRASCTIQGSPLFNTQLFFPLMPCIPKLTIFTFWSRIWHIYQAESLTPCTLWLSGEQRRASATKRKLSKREVLSPHRVFLKQQALSFLGGEDFNTILKYVRQFLVALLKNLKIFPTAKCALTACFQILCASV